EVRTSRLRSDRKPQSVADRLEVFLERGERALEIAQYAFSIARIQAERLALGDDLPLPLDDLAALLHVTLRYRERIDGHAAFRISSGTFAELRSQRESSPSLIAEKHRCHCPLS